MYSEFVGRACITFSWLGRLANDGMDKKTQKQRNKFYLCLVQPKVTLLALSLALVTSVRMES